MRIADRDLNRDVLIVAEIGNNHEGSRALAEEMIGRAAAAGADAVKFQTFRTEHYVSRRDEARFHRLKSFELSCADFERLAGVTRAANVLFLSTPFDIESARFLDGLVPAFKIASGDNTFYPLLEAVAGFGKPILLSAGLADLSELRRAKALIEQVWQRNGVRQELAVLHCVTSYPVPPAEANLAAIGRLRQESGCTVGYSDHTIGIEAAVLAVALGARVIEKHFTLDKHYSDFRDHQLSADPAELAELVRRVREAVAMLGCGEKVPQACEKANFVAARRSVAVRRDMPAGAGIAWDDLTWVRPGGGVPPGDERRVLGRVLRQAVQAGDILTLDMFEEPGT